jgi:putative ABC transport system substrate-binding protein
VRAGLVKSLSRPEGNITGFAKLAADISAKLLQMLLSIVPNLKRVAVLLNPTNPGHSAILKNIQSAA